MEEIDEWGFPIKNTKYHTGDTFFHTKWKTCKVIDVDSLNNTYVVETEECGIKKLAASIIDNVCNLNEKEEFGFSTKMPSPKKLKLISGQYRNQTKKDFNKKEYLFKDDTEGGLKVGDFALAYTHRVNRCVPIRVTKVDVPYDVFESLNIKKSELVSVKHKINEILD